VGRSEAVQAAGGIVWRPGRDGTTEVALVHRPKYDDWSLPKGKLDPGERWEDAALREVREETGMTCRLGREAGSTRYTDGKGRLKVVRYWEMEPISGGFEPTEEIDELRWRSVNDASGRLTYDHDRALLEEWSRRDDRIRRGTT